MDERPYADAWLCTGCGWRYQFLDGDPFGDNWLLLFGAFCPIPDCNLPMEHYGCTADGNDCWGCDTHQDVTGLPIVYFYDSDLTLIEREPDMLYSVVKAQMQEVSHV